MPVWRVSADDCVDGAAIEQLFYAPSGFDWGGFDSPAHHRLDDWSGPAVLADVDLTEFGALPDVILGASGVVEAEFEFDPPMRYLHLCPDLSILTEQGNISELHRLDGNEVTGCPESNTTFSRPPDAELDCNRRWDSL